MNQEFLGLFVASENEPREELRAPFIKGAFVYATDGCISIRVPTWDGAPFVTIDDKFLSLPGLFDAHRRADFIPLPALPDQAVCRDCDGSGAEDCDGEIEECMVCYGKGVELVAVDAGITRFQNYYLHKVVKLPGLKFSTHPSDIAAAAYFTFDKSGEGLLMPISKWMLTKNEGVTCQ